MAASLKVLDGNNNTCSSRNQGHDLHVKKSTVFGEWENRTKLTIEYKAENSTSNGTNEVLGVDACLYFNGICMHSTLNNMQNHLVILQRSQTPFIIVILQDAYKFGFAKVHSTRTRWFEGPAPCLTPVRRTTEEVDKAGFADGGDGP